MSIEYRKVTYYSYNCAECGKSVTSQSTLKCANCSVYLCGKCGEICLCAQCRSILPQSIINGLYRSKRIIKFAALGLVFAGIAFFIMAGIGLTSVTSSVIIGFLLMIFAIPYYALSILVFFPKKARNAKYRSGNDSDTKNPTARFDGKVDMSRHPLSTLFKCPKCGTETPSNPVYTGEDGKYFVNCKCGEKVNADHCIYQCSKCKKYYPDGVYRCPKCKWDAYHQYMG